MSRGIISGGVVIMCSFVFNCFFISVILDFGFWLSVGGVLGL